VVTGLDNATKNIKRQEMKTIHRMYTPEKSMH